ncbi:MAG TPA: DUF6531 domain-containing protein [Solirubrobacteraceae bacterium]|jgi:YD repeat-containing protein|nr:DUF6531 domain-containing protein [Solirubrobacteraceae bacterium]
MGVALDTSGNLYFAEPYGGVYKVATSGVINAVSGLSGGVSVAVDGDDDLLVVTTADDGRILERAASSHTQWGRSLTSGSVYTVVGGSGGICGHSGDGGPAYASLLCGPTGIALDVSGDLFVADESNTRVQKVSASSGDVATVAGSSWGVTDVDGDGGPATSALLGMPLAVTADSAGNLFVAVNKGWQPKYAADPGAVREVPAGTTSSFPVTPAPASRGGAPNPAAPGLVDLCLEACGDPVNTANGDFYETSTDASVSTHGPRLAFERTYDSLTAQTQSAAGTPGPLGYGWSDNWAMSLSSRSGLVTVTEGNGANVTFASPVGGVCEAPYVVGSGATGTYCALADVTASLTYDSGSSTYTFVTHPYMSYTFNSSGQLASESGPGGATLSAAYNTPTPSGSGACPSSASSCETVSSASGRALVIASNSSGEVTKVTDPLGRRWSYSYSSGDLASVTDPLTHVTSYTYDSANATPAYVHDLLTVTRPNGQSGGPDAGDREVNAYNAAGQVGSQTDPAGNETTFDYSNLDIASGVGYTLTTDPDGNQTKYGYSGGLLVSKTLDYGGSTPSTWAYTHDPTTLLLDEVTDPDSHTTTTSYDADGNVTSKTDGLGDTSTYSYNAFDEAVCAALPLAAASCSSLSPPAAIGAGGTISPPSSAPPKYVTFSRYDTTGNEIWATTGDYDPGSGTASQSRTSYQLYTGESVTLGSTTDSCTVNPAATSLPCARIDPDAIVTQIGYDSAGDQASSATPDGNAGGEVAEKTYSYDGDGERQTTTAPDGNVSGANAADYRTTDTYTADGQLATVTQSHTGGSIAAREAQYGYDANGNRTSVTDARGKTSGYAFDPDDRVTLVTDPDGQQTLICYDGDGNVTQTVPAVGVAASSLGAGSCPDSFPGDYGDRLASDATTYAHDALGDKTVITSPAPTGLSGHETTTNAYDAAGRLSSTTAPPASNAGGAPSQVTAYTYDAAGRLLTRTSGSGTGAASTTSYCYDPDGEKTASVAADGTTSGVPACSGSSPYQTSSAYQTGYEYDSLGEVYSETRPATSWASGGQSTGYAYDPAGNQVSSEDPNGVTTTRTFTPLDRVADISYSGSAAHAVAYAYDADGNRVSMSDATGTSTYGYDVFDELASHENGAGQTVAYAYDGDGDTTSVTYPLGVGRRGLRAIRRRA